MNRIRRTSKSQNQPAVPPMPPESSPTAAPENGTEAEYVAAEQQPEDTLADVAPEGVVSPDELAPASASTTASPAADLETQPPSDIIPSTDADMGGDIEAPVPVALTEMEDGGATPQADMPDAEAPGEQSPADVTSAAPVAEADAAAAVDGEAPDTNPDLDTSPQLGAVEREELTSLPTNSVVDGKYTIGSLLHHAEDRNLYRVSTRKQQKCPYCGRISALGLADCPYCGSVLSGQPAAEFYLMAESYSPLALMQDPGIMELNLYHPNLVPVVDFFSYTPLTQVRYYAVAEPRQGVRLSQLSLPRSGSQVLNWAMQLADALDYLHSRGVVGAGAEADDILVQGDRASLASLQNARVKVESADELTQQQVIDIARLAGTMYEAYTGHAASMSPEGILPMPSSAPEQVGQAFRTAIEPAQGVAAPVSAARWRDLLAVALEAVAELERPGKPVAFTAAGLTNVGRLRDNNQDSFGMVEFVQGSAERPLRIGLYVVADGLGGHKGGEIASALAIEAFCGEVMSRVVSLLVTAASEQSVPNNEAIFASMVRAAQTANERIYRGRDNRLSDMATTLVSALIAGGKAYIVNIGDSRLYHYAKPRGSAEAGVRENAPIVKGTTPLAGTAPLVNSDAPVPVVDTADVSTDPVVDRDEFTLVQVSVDHSLVHRLVELGQLDPEEAKVHPHRNFIYRSLGGPPPIEVDTFVRTLQPGDRMLLNSDGLNSMIEDDAIQGVLASAVDPGAAAQQLIDLANEAGGHDNITTIVIDISGYLPLPEHPAALNNM